MSMRATFTTDFIYDFQEGWVGRRTKMCEILGGYASSKGGDMIGQISGITKGLDLSEQDIRDEIEELAFELHKVTGIPFRIVWLLEGGDLICKEIMVMTWRGGSKKKGAKNGK